MAVPVINFKKVHSDMQIRPTWNAEEKSLKNVARDIALVMSCTELFYNEQSKNIELSYIASSDITLKLILQEICVAEVVSSSYQDKYGEYHTENSPKFGLRPNGISSKDIYKILALYPPIPMESSLLRQDLMKIKRHRLKITAKKIRTINVKNKDNPI